MRHVLLILICIASFPCFGQEMGNDIYTKSYAVPDSTAKSSDEFIGEKSTLVNKGLSSGLKESVGNKNLNKPVIFETIRTPRNMPEPGTAYIPLWRNGGFSASGSISVMPGLMQIERGSFGFSQGIGKISLYMGAVANKYGYYNGLYTQYGVNGSLKYQFNPKLSFNVVGTYYFGQPPMMANGMPMPPSMIGYFGASTFGGYFSYQFNETFGLDVGAQTVRQFGTNRYYLEPIVTPTIKVGKVKFGIPAGQILYDIIRSHVEEHRNRR